MRTLRRRAWLTTTVAGAIFACLVMPSTAVSADSTPRGTASPGSPDSGDSLFPHQGNGGYDARHYAIGLTWHHSGTIRATTAMTATSTQALSAFNLDLKGLTVQAVTVNSVAAQFSRSGSELTITPATPIPDHARFVAVVHYGGTPHWLTDPDGSPDGWIETRDGATALNEPIGSMTWFPNNNTPRDKATYQITVTAPRALTVESNGRLLGRTTHGRTATWVWRERDQMASYLSSVSIGSYDVVHGRTASGIRVTSYLDPVIGGHKIAGRVPGVIDYWSKLFGPYPFTSTGIVLDNVPVGYALETQTRPVFPGIPGVSTLVHELAHQWYGDSVTPKDWSDIWLNEGFATYAEWLWEARQHRGYPRKTFLALYRTHSAGDSFWDRPVAKPGSGANLFSDAVYTRGAMALQAIRMEIGGPAFFHLLKRWPALHHEGNATTGMLKKLAERLSGKDLDQVFHAWLYTGAKPTSP